MGPLTMKIGEAAAKLLWKHGKEGLKKLLTQPVVEKVATDTQLDFPELEIRETLLKWSQNDDFFESFDRIREGERNEMET
ncbi:MAG TPA: hypothetical protein VHE60_05205 [Pyrinomonadaceae bacterium]|nr:hypothetical protein [Pyrinomonadaceae bacterium]